MVDQNHYQSDMNVTLGYCMWWMWSVIISMVINVSTFKQSLCMKGCDPLSRFLSTVHIGNQPSSNFESVPCSKTGMTDHEFQTNHNPQNKVQKQNLELCFAERRMQILRLNLTNSGKKAWNELSDPLSCSIPAVIAAFTPTSKADNFTFWDLSPKLWNFAVSEIRSK